MAQVRNGQTRHIVLFAAGTHTVSSIVAPALRRIAERHGGRLPRWLHPITVGFEDAGALGMGAFASCHIPLNPISEVVRTVSLLPGSYPYLYPGAVRAISRNERGVGDGNQASPGLGRVSLSLVVPRLVTRLRQIDRTSRGCGVQFLQVVQPHSGTSRGALVDPPALAGRYLRDAYRRVMMVLPAEDAVVENAGLHARNTLSALRHLDDGTRTRRRFVHDVMDSGWGERDERLWDDSVLVWSDFRTGSDRSLGGIASLPELHGVASRLVEGLASRDELYRQLDDYLNNQAWQRNRRLPSGEPDGWFHHILAVGEGRVHYRPELFERRIRADLLRRLGALLPPRVVSG